MSDHLYTYLLIGYKSEDQYSGDGSNFIIVDNVTLSELMKIYKKYIDKGYELYVHRVDISLKTQELIENNIDNALDEFYKNKQKEEEIKRNLQLNEKKEEEYKLYLSLKEKYEAGSY